MHPDEVRQNRLVLVSADIEKGLLLSPAESERGRRRRIPRAARRSAYAHFRCGAPSFAGRVRKDSLQTFRNLARPSASRHWWHRSSRDEGGSKKQPLRLPPRAQKTSKRAPAPGGPAGSPTSIESKVGKTNQNSDLALT